MKTNSAICRNCYHSSESHNKEGSAHEPKSFKCDDCCECFPANTQLQTVQEHKRPFLTNKQIKDNLKSVHHFDTWEYEA